MCHEELVNKKMEKISTSYSSSWTNATNFSRHEVDRSQRAVRWHFFKVLSAEYERVRLTSYEKRSLRLYGIRHAVRTMYTDKLSHSSNSKLITARDVAMQADGHKGSDVQCNYCKGVGYLLQDCTILEAK